MSGAKGNTFREGAVRCVPRWVFALAFPLAFASACGSERPSYASFGSGVRVCIVDEDRDGYGLGCPAGDDCNDLDPSVHEGCAACDQPNAGCPCAPGSSPVECISQELLDHDTLLCHAGERFCQDGQWTECLGVVSFEAEVPRRTELGRAAQALLGDDLGTTPCSPCRPSCFPVEDPLDEVPGGLDATNSSNIAWVSGGGITIGFTGGGEPPIIGSDADCASAVPPDGDCDGVPDPIDTTMGRDATYGTTFETLYMDLIPGEQESARVVLPTVLRGADVYFLLDTTEAQGAVVNGLANHMNTGTFFDDPSAVTCADTDFDGEPNEELKGQGIAGNIACLVRDGALGAGWVREIPFTGPDAAGIRYGDADEQLFEHAGDIGLDPVTLAQRIAGFRIDGNFYGPNAPIQALHVLVTGGESYVGWDRPAVPPRVGCPGGTFGYPCFRANALPVVVLFTGEPLYNGPTPASGTLGMANGHTYPVSYPASIHTGQLSAGTYPHYLPVVSANENFASAYPVATADLGGAPAGAIQDDFLTFTGDTRGMAADLTAEDLRCAALTNDEGPDAVFQFEVTSTSTLTVSTQGTRFPNVLGVIKAGVPGVSEVRTNLDLGNQVPTGNSVSAPIDLGTLPRGVSLTARGSTEGAAATYPRELLGCFEQAAPMATSDYAGQALYRFRVAQDMTLRFATEAGTPLESLALFERAPGLGAYTNGAVDTGTDFVATGEDITVPGSINGSAVRVIGGYTGTGDTRRATNLTTANQTANVSSLPFNPLGCDPVSGFAEDVIVRFTLTAPTRVRIETSGDGPNLSPTFTHFIGLFPGTDPNGMIACAINNYVPVGAAAPVGRAVIERDLAAGNYSVVVRGSSYLDVGEFRLTIRDVNHAPRPVACLLHPATDAFEYELRACADGFTAPCPGNEREYFLVMRGQNAGDAAGGTGDYTLTVRDKDAPTPIDVCGAGLASSFTGQFTPGTYYAVVKGQTANDQGLYQLTVGDASRAQNQSYEDLASWSGVRDELLAAGVRVASVRTGNHAALVEQLTTIASATGAVSSTAEPLVEAVNLATGTVQTDIARAVVRTVQRLAEGTTMDVSLRLVAAPDTPSPMFSFAYEPVDRPGDGCDPPVNGAHVNCRSGATPEFSVTFGNPEAPNNVPDNPNDPRGGYWLTLELVGDGRYVLEQIPVYLVPRELTADPSPISHADSGTYWQDFGTPNCTAGERPRWSRLSWAASIPEQTSLRFALCTAETRTGLNGCVPQTLARVTVGDTCATDSECTNGFCQAGRCQFAEGPTCELDEQCGENGVCAGGRCRWTALPIDPQALLRTHGHDPWMRLAIELTSDPARSAAPIVHQWRIEYECSGAE